MIMELITKKNFVSKAKAYSYAPSPKKIVFFKQGVNMIEEEMYLLAKGDESALLESFHSYA